MDHPAKRVPQGSVFDIEDASPLRGGSRNPSPPFHPPPPPTPPPASSLDSTLPPQEASGRPCQVPSTPPPASEIEKPGAEAARQSERADREDIKREMNKYQEALARGKEQPEAMTKVGSRSADQIRKVAADEAKVERRDWAPPVQKLVLETEKETVDDGHGRVRKDGYEDEDEKKKGKARVEDEKPIW